MKQLKVSLTGEEDLAGAGGTAVTVKPVRLKEMEEVVCTCLLGGCTYAYRVHNAEDSGSTHESDRRGVLLRLVARDVVRHS